jgi:hypothetical protein
MLNFDAKQKSYNLINKKPNNSEINNGCFNDENKKIIILNLFMIQNNER